VIEAHWRQLSVGQLVRVVVGMCRSGFYPNTQLLDTTLLPGLEPHLSALVQHAASQQIEQLGELQGKQGQLLHSKEEPPFEWQGHRGALAPGLLDPEQVASLLPALAALDCKPRAKWWALYQDALAASLERVDVFTLAEALEAVAALQLPVKAPLLRLVLSVLPPKRVRLLDQPRMASLLVGFGHLADASAGNASAFDARVARVLWHGAGSHVASLSSRCSGSETSGGGVRPMRANSGGDSRGGDGGSDGDDDSCSSSGEQTGAIKLGQLCCNLLQAAGKLQRARPDLGPPGQMVTTLLAGSKLGLAAGSLPPPALAQLARSVQVLGAAPDDDWVNRCASLLGGTASPYRSSWAPPPPRIEAWASTL
jgi:hypothetical protein